MGVLLGVSPGGGIGWEDRTTVGLAPGGLPLASLGNYNYVRGRL